MSTGIGDNPFYFSWAVSSVIAEICDRVGVPADCVDLYGLDSFVDGFYCDNTVTAAGTMQNLSQVFMFDPSCRGGKITFVPRGLDVVSEITSDDLIDDGETIEKLTKRDAMSIARVYNMDYYDIDGALANNTATSDRSIDSRATQEVSTSTNVLLNTNDANRVVAINHKIAVEEQRGTYEFSLPNSFLFITTGDCIRLNGERLRISQIEYNDGYQSYKAVFDRQSAYQSTITATPAPLPSVPPDRVIGDTILNFVDIPILRDADDKLGYYVAITGSTTKWTGALVELSTDGGGTYTQSYSGDAESVSGVVTVGCGVHSVYYPDEVNTITVRLANIYLTLESASLSQLMNRTNLAIVGNELISFGEINEVSPGIYELSYLLRGRKGTEISSHSAGERFVLLDRQSLYFIPSDLYLLNKQLTFKSTSYGKDTSLITQATFYGESQKEKAPNYLQAERGGGNIEISWQGSGRLGAGVNSEMGAYFSHYLVSVGGVTQATTDETITVSDRGGSFYISVRGVNSLTGLGDESVIHSSEIKTVISVDTESIWEKIMTPSIHDETSYTLLLTDKGKAIEMTSSSANYVVIPSETLANFEIGSGILITQAGTGKTTIIVNDQSVTLRNPHGTSSINAQWGTAVIRKRASNDWVIEGNLAEN